MIENEEREKEREREERREAGGKGRREGRVSSSCNAIDPVAVHHVDTILVRSFQTAGVVQVGFCAITSVAGPTCAGRTKGREAREYYILGARSFVDAMPIAPNRPALAECNVGGIYATNDSESLCVFSKLSVPAAKRGVPR